MSTLANSMKKVPSFSRFPSRVWSKEAKRGKRRQDHGKERERGWKKILDNKFKKLKERSCSLSDRKQISHSCNKKICESSSFVCLYGEGTICNGFQRRVGVSWKPALSFLSSLRKNNVFWTISARSTSRSKFVCSLQNSNWEFLSAVCNYGKEKKRRHSSLSPSRNW